MEKEAGKDPGAKPATPSQIYKILHLYGNGTKEYPYTGRYSPSPPPDLTTITRAEADAFIKAVNRRDRTHQPDALHERIPKGMKFYHASPRRFRHGDILRGGQPGGAGYCHDNVCITTNPDPHVTITNAIPGHEGWGGKHNPERYPEGTPDWFVYEVEPLMDPVWVRGNVEYQTKAARVVRLVGKAKAFLQRLPTDIERNIPKNHGTQVALPPHAELDRTLKNDDRQRRRLERWRDTGDEPGEKAAAVVAKFLRQGRDVRVLVDQDETRKVRERFHESPNGEGSIVGTFDSSVSLYRIMDGEELRRVVRTGKIIGGFYSVKAERAYGASWGENVSEIIAWGNRARGNRLGNDLFLAKIDARGKRFYHMNPKVPYDPSAPEQTYTMDVSRCSTGLGCSVIDVAFDEVSFYRVDATSGQMSPMTDADIKAYVSERKEKVIELRQVSPVFYHGTMYGVDVYVVKDQSESAYRHTWSVVNRDEEKLVIGAKSEKIAIDNAAKILRYGRHGQPTVDLLPKAVMNEWRKRQPKYAHRIVARWEAMREIGTVGVDSGTLLVIDPCYIKYWDTGEHPDLTEEGRRQAWHEGRHQLYFNNGIPAAIWIKGMGDGNFPVLVDDVQKDDNGSLIGGFAVELMGPEEMAEHTGSKMASAFKLPQNIPMNEVWKKAPEMLATLSSRQIELLNWLATVGDIAGGKGPNIALNRGFGKTRTKGEVFPERHLMSELRVAGWVRWETGAMADFGYYHLTESAEKVWTAKGRKTSMERIAGKYLVATGYFNIGDIVLMGKYKNSRGKVVGFGQDHWGNPTVEIEPIPKGRKQNKIIGLYKIWRADVKEKALAELAAKGGVPG